MSEHDEQAMLFQWAEHASGRYPELRLLYAVPNSGGFSGGFKSNVARVQRLKRTGTKKGVPDICLPVARGGFHALYIELKAPGGRLKPEQSEWLSALSDAGNLATWAVGWEAAQRTIESYLRQPAPPLPPSPDPDR